MCDGCGTHAYTLAACAACTCVWYCSRACQTRAWRTHHRRVCGELALDAAAQRAEGVADAATAFSVVATPASVVAAFEYVRTTMASSPAAAAARAAGRATPVLGYTAYLAAVHAYLEPGGAVRAVAADVDAPPAVREVLVAALHIALEEEEEEAEKEVLLPSDASLGTLMRLLDAQVRSAFAHLTLRALPSHSAMPFEHLHATEKPTRAAVWSRHPADNAKTRIASLIFDAVEGNETLVWRSMSFASASACLPVAAMFSCKRTCAAALGVVVLLDGRVCARHAPAAVAELVHSDLRRIDVCVPSTGLDVASAVEVLRRVERATRSCACAALPARADTLLGPDARLIDVAVVRASFANGARLDVVYVARRSAKHPVCSACTELCVVTSLFHTRLNLDVYETLQPLQPRPAPTHPVPLPAPARTTPRPNVASAARTRTR